MSSGGIMNSPLMKSGALKAVIGYFTGGAGGAAMGLVGSKNPNAGQALSLAGASGGGSASSPDQGGQPDQGNQLKSEAMVQRISNLEQDPQAAVTNALGPNGINHPDFPPELREHAAFPLLMAKHYYMNGHEPPDHVHAYGDQLYGAPYSQSEEA